MKIYLTILLSFLLLPVLAFAALGDLVMGSPAQITIGSDTFVVSGSASLDSITVTGSNFSVILSRGSGLTVTSANKRNFSISPSTYTAAIQGFSCDTSQSTLTLGNSIWDSAVTVTITPSSDACIFGGSGGGSSGGGGGGGGGVPAPVYTVIPGTEVAVAPVTTPTVLAPSAVSVSPVFTKTMKMGMSSADIKRLQQVLNSDPDTQIAASGVGSPGNETEYFGSLTRKAIQKFQEKYGIVSSGDEMTTGYGLVGPGTRAKLAEVFAQAAAPTLAEGEVGVPTPQVVGISPVFSSGMGRGMSKSDIKRLQQVLNSDADTQIAASGVGSPGNETEYFGSLTEKAVQKFQEKHGIAKSGDAGYGYVGPKTRAKLTEVFGSQSSAPSTPATPTTDTTALQAQIQTLLQQVEALQAQLNAM